ENGAAGTKLPLLLGADEHRQCGAILGPAGRIAVLQLPPHTYVRRGRQVRQTDQRCVTVRAAQGVAPHGTRQPPAPAGGVTTTPPSDRSMLRRPLRRTASPWP